MESVVYEFLVNVPKGERILYRRYPEMSNAYLAVACRCGTNRILPQSNRHSLPTATRPKNQPRNSLCSSPSSNQSNEKDTKRVRMIMRRAFRPYEDIVGAAQITGKRVGETRKHVPSAFFGSFRSFSCEKATNLHPKCILFAFFSYLWCLSMFFIPCSI